LTVLPNDPTQEVFVDKFIGFVDILGFTNMVHDAEAGRGMSLGALLNATKDLPHEIENGISAVRSFALTPRKSLVT
jgi:hypothetical protein